MGRVVADAAFALAMTQIIYTYSEYGGAAIPEPESHFFFVSVIVAGLYLTAPLMPYIEPVFEFLEECYS